MFVGVAGHRSNGPAGPEDDESIPRAAEVRGHLLGLLEGRVDRVGEHNAVVWNRLPQGSFLTAG